jgi:hypothetical protein
MRRTLITGITGQDGSYLAEFLTMQARTPAPPRESGQLICGRLLRVYQCFGLARGM